MILVQVITAIGLGNNISQKRSPNSEADVIRSALGFRDQGLMKYYGLPDNCYTDRWPGRGIKKSASIESCVYTHYPPGPQYIYYAGLLIFGDNAALIRIFFPILLSLIVGFYFLKTMMNLFDDKYKGAILGAMLILVPMYSNYMFGLHQHQYQFALFQLQLILTIKIALREKLRFIDGLYFSLIGFIQGWMTFDFAFVTIFASTPLLFIATKDKLLSFKQWFIITFLTGFFFTLAHAVHFYQVVLYLESFDLAYKDMFETAKYRAAGDHVKFDPSQFGPFTVMKDFLYRVAGRGKYLALNLINFIWIIVGLKFIREIKLNNNKIFSFNITWKDIAALTIAVAISGLWSIVMKNHAWIHGHVARHYYFCYMVACMIIVSKTKLSNK